MTFKASLFEDLSLAYWNYVSTRDRPAISVKNRMGQIISSNDNEDGLKDAAKIYCIALRRYQDALKEEGHKFC